jgi:beta-lactam-binding protein with PASTA domain
MMQRLAPGAVTEEIAEPAGPPPERYWWLWLLLLLVLVAAGLLLWWLLSRENDKSTVPDVIGLKSQVAAQKHPRRPSELDRGHGPEQAAARRRVRTGAGRRHAARQGQTVTISISSGHVPVPNVTDQPVQQAQTAAHERRLQELGHDTWRRRSRRTSSSPRRRRPG